MKYVKSTVITVVLSILFFLHVPSIYAWDDCVKGKVNDPYPGDCARYIDTDGNGICDHSEPAPEDRVLSNSSSLEETDTSEPEYAYAGNVSSENRSDDGWISLVASPYVHAGFFTVMSLLVISLYALVHKQKVISL